MEMADIQNEDFSIESLHSKLDELFERYLTLLDEYQIARQQLSTHMSSGFLCLAKANFASANHIRFGQDYYDERMQAGRVVFISENVELSTYQFEVRKFAPLIETADVNPGTTDVSENVEKENLPTPPSTPTTSGQEVGQTETQKEASSTGIQKSADPLRWFGILVPPALRSAQSSFIDAVDGPIPKLTSLAANLRAVESEINKTRKLVKKRQRHDQALT